MIHHINKKNNIIEDMKLLKRSDQEVLEEDINFIYSKENDLYLFPYHHYKRLIESTNNNLAKVLLKNDIEIDKIGVIINEEELIDNTQEYIDACNNIGKVFIRRLNTDNEKNILENITNQYLETGNEVILEGITDYMKGVKKGLNDPDVGIKAQIKSTAIGSGIKLGGAALLTGGLIYGADKLGKRIADNDARELPENRSDLIRILRVMQGKLPEYVSKYDVARYEQKSRLGKIIDKIKEIIRKILRKLRLRDH